MTGGPRCAHGEGAEVGDGAAGRVGCGVAVFGGLQLFAWRVPHHCPRGPPEMPPGRADCPRQRMAWPWSAVGGGDSEQGVGGGLVPCPL